MTIEEMKNRKKELGYSNKTIAEKSGVPLGTVQKIFSGITSSPREDTIRALERVLRADYTGRPVSYVQSPDSSAGLPWDSVVREAAPAYGKPQNHRPPAVTHGAERLYTIDDYMALPDEQRVELIDGVFYEMTAPTTNHQGIAGFLHKKLLDHVLEHKGPCYPFIAPIDVQLDSDDYTVVQPDVLIVCDRSKYKNGRVFGAPDLVIEVLSPSTRKKDMQLKHHKYGNAGVREYWIIDPETKTLIQYDLEHLAAPVLHGFDSTVPVLIWDGACQISLAELYEATAFLWETE